ncbi:MAG: amidohydrolase family protein [Planctomycetia bacterium]|nr:amidohydrolase family protein [Planctomycetia bacterium]
MPLLGSHGKALAEQAAAPAGDLTNGAVDAHSHVWTPDVKRYPLSAAFKPTDMQPPSFTPQQLLAHARPCGVSRVVLIQMSYYGFDNRYMLDSMHAFPGVFSGVAVIDEHAAPLRDTMRDLKKQGVRGFRIHPAGQDVDRWLSSPGMAYMWKIGADEQLAMCGLINPEALTAIDRMCEKFPDTPVVIDHFARIGVDGTIRDSDVAKLSRLARHNHTHVKISAFYALGKKKSPYLDLAEMIRSLLNAFGPERLMWATDCPYQVQEGHKYLDSIELVRSRLDFLSDADREWLLKKTAQRVFFS